MLIRRFEIGKDLEPLSCFLRELYHSTSGPVFWLPERLHDLLYRVAAQEREDGRAISSDYIFLWEQGQQILACLLPDGENVYLAIRPGYESLFPAMISYAEANCLPLFPAAVDGTRKFWVAVSDRLAFASSALQDMSYQRYESKEYLSCCFPQENVPFISLPPSFQLLYGEFYPDEEKKWSALRLGFHPELENPDYKADLSPYTLRKQSNLYPDSFECIIVDSLPPGSNDVCAYCFVYVDQHTKTALIEPVSTREAYRHRGLGTAMLHGVILRCRDLGIEKCYVDSFGSRKDFYAAAGFHIEDSISFWYKTLDAGEKPHA